MTLKTITTALILASAISSGATAGSFTVPASADPISHAADSTDWQGFYIGAHISATDAPVTVLLNGVFSNEVPSEATLYGGFAGYNVQRGNFVFGGEAAFNFGRLNAGTGWTENYIDLKARAGFAAGNALIYGFAGYTMADLVESTGASPDLASGLNFGAGVDYQLRNGLFVGVDYTLRNLSGDYDQNLFPGYSFEIPANSISHRVGKQF